MIDIKNFKNFRLIGILLTILLLLPLSGICGEAKFVIFHTSDIHGNISAHADPTAKASPKPMMGGFAAFKKVIDSYRNNSQYVDSRVLYLDSGDFFQGTPVVDRTRGKVMVDMMNKAGLDAITLGNHEFDYTYENLIDQLDQKEFSVVCCNVIEKATRKLPDFAQPYKIFIHKGKKIGLIGIDTPQTKMMSIERNVRALEFLPPEKIVKGLIKKLRKAKVDFIILLSHLGIEGDMKFVEEVSGIDLVLGGHSHTLRTELTWAGPFNTPIVHSGASLEHTSIIKISLDDNGESNIELKSQPLYVEETGIDKEMTALEDEYLKDIRKEMARVIGSSKVNLYRGVNGGDSPAGSFISDAMREASKADFAFINFGGVRQSFFKGLLTVESIFLVQPFNNYIEVIDMTGEQLLHMIESSISNPFKQIEDIDKAYALEHYNIKAEGLRRIVGPKFGYLFPSNLKITFDPTKEPMNRIVEVVQPDGTKLDPEKVYKVALNDFLAAGGDGYTFLNEYKIRNKTGILVRDAVLKFVEDRKVIESKPEKRMFNLRLTEESLD